MVETVDRCFRKVGMNGLAQPTASNLLYYHLAECENIYIYVITVSVISNTNECFHFDFGVYTHECPSRGLGDGVCIPYILNYWGFQVKINVKNENPQNKNYELHPQCRELMGSPQGCKFMFHIGGVF